MQRGDALQLPDEFQQTHDVQQAAAEQQQQAGGGLPAPAGTGPAPAASAAGPTSSAVESAAAFAVASLGQLAHMPAAATGSGLAGAAAPAALGAPLPQLQPPAGGPQVPPPALPFPTAAGLPWALPGALPVMTGPGVAAAAAAAAAAVAAAAAPAVQQAAAASAQHAPGVPPKKKPGRQKRTSIPCQVPGCGVELVNEKGYYRRYRICQTHCSMPSMMLDGREQRFCQQCGRFQDIGEFEGAKKSCKRKLKRHNERRRVEFVREESQEESGMEGESEETEEEAPKSKARGRLGASAASGQRSRLASASTAGSAGQSRSVGGPSVAVEQEQQRAEAPQAASAGAVALPSAPAAGAGALAVAAAASASAADLQRSLRQQQQQQALATAGQGVPGFADVAALPTGLLPLPLPGPAPLQLGAPLPPPMASAPEGTPQAQQTQQAQQAQQQQSISPPDLALPELHLASASPLYLDLPSPFLGSTPSSGSMPRPPSAGGPSLHQQHLSAPRALSLDVAAPASASLATPGSIQPAQAGPAAQQVQAAVGADKMAAAGGGPAAAVAADAGVPITQPVATRLALAPAGSAALPEPQGGGGGGGAPVAMALLQQAQPAQAAPYIPDERLVRMSMKVFNCTPEQLLPLVRAELERLLESSPAMLEGYIRPGCTHLTLNLRLRRREAAALRLHTRLMGRMLAPAGAFSAVLASRNVVLQVDSQLAVMRSGQVVASGIDLQQHPAAAAAPRLLTLHPFCVLSSHPGCIALTGSNISGTRDLILCRQQGHHLATEVLSTSGHAGDQAGTAALPPAVDAPLRRYDSTARSAACGAARRGSAAAPTGAAALAAMAADAATVPGDCAGLTAGASPSTPDAAPLCCSFGSEGDSKASCDTARPAVLPQQRLALSAVEAPGDEPAGKRLRLWHCGNGGAEDRQQQQERALQLGEQPQHQAQPAGAAAEERVLIKPLGVVPGCVEVEVQRGSVLSAAQPLLALPCAAAVAEVRQLATPGGREGISSVSCFLRDTGVVVQYLYRHQLAASGYCTPRYGPVARRGIALLAQRLTACAASRGWAALAALLQPATRAASDDSDADVAVALGGSCSPAGADVAGGAAACAAAPAQLAPPQQIKEGQQRQRALPALLDGMLR